MPEDQVPYQEPQTDESPQAGIAGIATQQALATAAIEETSQIGNVLTTINRIASRKDIDVARIEKMLDLYDRLHASHARACFARAMVAMQPELPIIGERGEIIGKNDKVQSTYAHFEDIWEEVCPIVNRHGFYVNFKPDVRGDQQVVTAILGHVEGHSDEATVQLPIDTGPGRNTVQSIISSTSYAKRIALIMVLNITTRGQDDDGQRADTTTYITNEQVAEVRGILDQVTAITGENEAQALCAALGVQSLAAIPKRDFDKARNSSLAKLRQKQERAQ